MDRQRTDHGFTLIEVLIAMMLLATTAVGVVVLFAASAAAVRSAKITSSATVLAGEKLEQLRSLRWAYDDTGVPVSDMSTDLSAWPPTGAGRGLTVSPADTLVRNTVGYVDYVDAAGRWVGNGTSPGAEAVFVRRWSIQPAEHDPLNSLEFRVLVIPAVARVPMAGSLSAAGAIVIGMKTRTVL